MHVALRVGLPDDERRAPRLYNASAYRTMHRLLVLAGSETRALAEEINIVNPGSDWGQQALARAKAARGDRRSAEHMLVVKELMAARTCWRSAPQLQDYRRPPKAVVRRNAWHERLHAAHNRAEDVERCVHRAPPMLQPSMRFALDERAERRPPRFTCTSRPTPVVPRPSSTRDPWHRRRDTRPSTQPPSGAQHEVTQIRNSDS